jgi:hypothetical protein
MPGRSVATQIVDDEIVSRGTYNERNSPPHGPQTDETNTHI